MRNRAAATSRFDLPSATSSAIRRLGLRQLAARRCAAADPRELGASLLGPERRTERSKRASASSSVARAAPRCFARRCVRPRASSVRARENGSTSRACSASARSKLAKAPSRSPRAASSERAAAREDRERPRAVDGDGPRLPLLEDACSLVELSRSDQRFEEVTELDAHPGLVHEGVAQLVRASQVRKRGRRCRPGRAR